MTSIVRTVLAVFGCQVALAQDSAPAKAPAVVPAPARVLGLTQIKDPKAMATPQRVLTVSIDTTRITADVPQITEWANHAAKLCTEWYPAICQALGVEKVKPSRHITLVFVPTLPPPIVAIAGDDVIAVSAEKLVRNFSDYGMVVHELAHLVQAYPNGSGMFGWLHRQNHDMAWLAEGIADYFRFYLYEADPSRGGIAPGRNAGTSMRYIRLSWTIGRRKTAADGEKLPRQRWMKAGRVGGAVGKQSVGMRSGR